MREYTVREYDMDDYDIQRDKIDNMTYTELAEAVRGIARGWLPDYNFTGEEGDFDNHKRQMIMSRVARLLEEGKISQ